MTHRSRGTARDFTSGLMRTTRSLGVIIGAVLAATVTATPASANSSFHNSFDEAHSVRSLDIMLMVTALRCRSGAHDFQNDYHSFSATNLEHLNAASDTLKRTFRASYGEPNPARALDRMGVKIANTYGDGHPWLSCAELKQVTQSLSQSADAQSLAVNARYLLSGTRPNSQIAPQIVPQIAAQSSQDSQGVQITYNMTAQWEQRP